MLATNQPFTTAVQSTLVLLLAAEQVWPAHSKELSLKFNKLIADTVQNNLGIEAIEKNADLIDERLGDIVRKARRVPSLTAGLFLIIIYLISRINININLDAKVDTKVDVNKLVEQVVNPPPVEIVNQWKTSVHGNDTGHNESRQRTNSVGRRTNPKRKK